MRIHLRDIGEATRELSFEESTSELNPLLELGPVHDYQFSGPALVRMSCYRAGHEVFFSGVVTGVVVGQCARCLESFEFALTAPVSLVFVPRAGRWQEEEEAGDIDVYVYDGEEIDLSPALRERILLALPTLPLCQDTCRGLCPRCGANRNRPGCECPTGEGNGPLSALRGLKIKQ